MQATGPAHPQDQSLAPRKVLVFTDGPSRDAHAPLKQRSEMKVQLASDLHLEHIEGSFRGERLIRPAFGAEILVLAGDIAEGTRAIELFGDWPVPVLYVAGNHEYYGGRRWEQKRADMRRASQGTSVLFLDCDAADLMQFEAWHAARMGGANDVRFLGCTLWTDYRYRCNRTQSQLMENAELRIADHRLIRTENGNFRAEDALRDHERTRLWLEQELAVPFDGKTVVISHHGPHALSVHPRYAGDALNGAFVSDLSDLLPRVDLWLHGHVHDSCDYRVGRCRVVANPRGYALRGPDVSSPQDLRFENAAFKPALVVEV
jgi:predicted phosphodiesterase